NRREAVGPETGSRADARQGVSKEAVVVSQCDANDHLVAQAPMRPVTTAGSAGSVILRGVTVALDSDVGEAFVIDCARNTEGLIPDGEIKTKYELSDQDWERLAGNTPVLHAVRAERERRIANGDAAREGAQRYFAKAPTILGDILRDNLASPRH